MVGVVIPKENPLQGYHWRKSINSNLKESVTRATLHCYYEFVLEAAMNVLLLNLDFGVEPRQLFNLKDMGLRQRTTMLLVARLGNRLK